MCDYVVLMCSVSRYVGWRVAELMDSPGSRPLHTFHGSPPGTTREPLGKSIQPTTWTLPHFTILSSAQTWGTVRPVHARKALYY